MNLKTLITKLILFLALASFSLGMTAEKVSIPENIPISPQEAILGIRLPQNSPQFESGGIAQATTSLLIREQHSQATQSSGKSLTFTQKFILGVGAVMAILAGGSCLYERFRANDGYVLIGAEERGFQQEHYSVLNERQNQSFLLQEQARISLKKQIVVSNSSHGDSERAWSAPIPLLEKYQKDIYNNILQDYRLSLANNTQQNIRIRWDESSSSWGFYSESLNERGKSIWTQYSIQSDFVAELDPFTKRYILKKFSPQNGVLESIYTDRAHQLPVYYDPINSSYYKDDTTVIDFRRAYYQNQMITPLIFCKMNGCFYTAVDTPCPVVSFSELIPPEWKGKSIEPDMNTSGIWNGLFRVKTGSTSYQNYFNRLEEKIYNKEGEEVQIPSNAYSEEYVSV